VITRHVFRPNASEDLDSQLDYYAREAGIDLALKFLDALEEAIRLLYQHPEAGSPRDFENSRLKGIRSWPVPGFEAIRLYYDRPDENTLRVVRILHGKRDLARLFEQEEE
jgi:toxin ParE1/3/4